jgi:hypothetical protein
MAHRGRLNVLFNIMQKSPKDIFAHFLDQHPELNIGRGDVKYHLGYSSDRVSHRRGRSVHLSLAFNPSHLEFVNPVVEGRVRAKQDRRGDRERKRVVPLLIHGDAAFIGQGVVAETLNLMSLEGYSTGGTLHIVVNNQVGFTTAHRRLALDALRHRPREACSASPSSTSTARTPRPSPTSRASPWTTARSSAATSSSTCTATASGATTRATSRASPSP